MRSSAPFVVLGWALIASWTGTPSGARQEDLSDRRPVFTTGVEMVTVNVAVLDSDGRPVLGLTAKEFVVIEDGVEAEVPLVLAPGDTPSTSRLCWISAAASDRPRRTRRRWKSRSSKRCRPTTACSCCHSATG